jgi:hypothetical protein
LIKIKRRPWNIPTILISNGGDKLSVTGGRVLYGRATNSYYAPNHWHAGAIKAAFMMTHSVDPRETESPNDLMRALSGWAVDQE